MCIRDSTGTMRLIGQLVGPTDWWAGAVNTNSWMTVVMDEFPLQNEFLFIQIWCHETAGLAAGKVMTLHMEGSDLDNTTRSLVQTPIFLPAYPDTASVAVTGQTGILSTSFCEAFFMSESTSDNTTDDHEQAAAFCRLVCGSIIAGTGFTIVAHPTAGQMIGTFNVRWVWA